MQGDFFLGFLYSSLIGAGLTVLIMIIKRLGKSSFSARWHYYIWFILLARLLNPVALDVPQPVSVKLSAWLHQLHSTSTRVSFPTQPAARANTGFTGFMPDYALSVTGDFLQSYLGTIFIVWLAGIIVLSALTITRNLKIWNQLKPRNTVQRQEVIELLYNCQKKCRIRSNIDLAQSEVIPSPIITGIFKPCILLPTFIIEDFTVQEIKYMFLHELAHYKQKDRIISWLTCILQILHWFNPLLWIAFFQIKQDREIACDAYALSFLGPENCKPYGETIIAILQRFSSGYELPVTCFIRNKNHLKQRISMIKNYHKESSTRIILKASFTVILGCILVLGTNFKTGVSAYDMPVMQEEIMNEDFSAYFADYEGSLVLLDESAGKCLVYNEPKSRERIAPCSTFKIVTALAALQTGVITDENSSMPWDGTVYPFDVWNQDQDLASAMKYSVDWYFKKLSKSIGSDKMQDYVHSIAYGNENLPDEIGDFSQQSPLRVSPLEQVIMLRNFYNYQMPFSANNIDAVKRVLRISQAKGAILSGKTGTGIVDGKYINGWFIGYVEKGSKVYYFAVNIQRQDNASGQAARNIVISILHDKGIY